LGHFDGVQTDATPSGPAATNGLFPIGFRLGQRSTRFWMAASGQSGGDGRSPVRQLVMCIGLFRRPNGFSKKQFTLDIFLYSERYWAGHHEFPAKIFGFLVTFWDLPDIH